MTLEARRARNGKYQGSCKNTSTGWVSFKLVAMLPDRILLHIPHQTLLMKRSIVRNRLGSEEGLTARDRLCPTTIHGLTNGFDPLQMLISSGTANNPPQDGGKGWPYSGRW